MFTPFMTRANINLAKRGRSLKGLHNGPEVLLREADVLAKTPFTTGLEKIRRASGEAGLVERITKRKFGTVGKTSLKRGRKMNTTKSPGLDINEMQL